MLATRIYKDAGGGFFRLISDLHAVRCDERGNKLHRTATVVLPVSIQERLPLLQSMQPVGTWEGFNQEGF